MAEEYLDPIQEEQGPTMGVLKRIFGMIFSPSATYADISRQPKIAKALIFILGLMVVFTAVTIPSMMNVLKKSMPSNIPQGATPPMAVLTAGVIFGVLVTLPITWLLVSAIYKVIFIITGEDRPFEQVFAVNLYAQVPILLGMLIKAVIILIKPSLNLQSVRTSLALLLPPSKATSPIYALLSTFDLFSIWTYVLVAVGFITVFKISRKKAYTIVISLFIGKLLLNVIPSFFMAKFLGGKLPINK